MDTAAAESTVGTDVRAAGTGAKAPATMPLVITIAREYGSGGREIGERLAARLGIAYYDKVLLSKIADKSGMASEVVESLDEKNPSFMFFNPSRFFAGTFGDTLPGQIHAAEVELIRSLAQEKPSVMVGRCIDSLLDEHSNVVRLFINAPLDDRIHRVMKRNDLNAEDALARIRHIDKERANYYRYMSDRKWGFAPNYDLCLNSAAVGIEGSVDMIVSFLEKAGKLPL